MDRLLRLDGKAASAIYVFSDLCRHGNGDSVLLYTAGLPHGMVSGQKDNLVGG